MSEVSYYFDTLPVHPHPKRFESFTSFVTRLAQANGVLSIRELSCLFFSHPTVLRYVEDYPLLLLRTISSAVACTTQELLSTTFYHLARKFGRSTRPATLKRFLSSSITASLRYCPFCLDQYSYCFLTWRFLMLPGCVEHACRFVDRCVHCGYAIPLLAFPPNIRACPACKGDLRAGSFETLTEQELQIARKRIVDIEFLLSPQSRRIGSNDIASTLRWRLAHLRKASQVLAEELSSRLDITLREIKGIEYKSLKGTGANFQIYVKYADYLDVTLSDLFTTALPGEESIREQEIKDRLLQHRGSTPLFGEKAMVRQVKRTIEQLKSSKQSVSQKSIAKALHLSIRDLRTYSSVREILAQLTAEQRLIAQVQLSEQELVERVLEIIQRQTASGQQVTQRTVCEEAGLSENRLMYYPRIATILKQAGLGQGRNNEQRPDEDELIKKVQQVIEHLKGNERPVTWNAISEMLQVPLSMFDHYPRLRELIKQNMNEPCKDRLLRIQLREDELVGCVEKIVQDLQALDQQITKMRISKAVPMSLRNLQKYPRVKALLDEVVEADLILRKVRSLQEEDELIEKVKESIRELESGNLPVTQSTISKMVKVPLSRLRSYSRVMKLLERVQVLGKCDWTEYNERREEYLVDQVERAIQQLELLGRPFSHETIGAIVDCTPETLNRYPRVRQLLVKGTTDRQQLQALQMQRRELELVEQVLAAKMQLESSGQPVMQKTISRMVGMSATALMHYSQVRVILEQIASDNRSAAELRVRQREQELVEQVLSAERKLEQLSQPVTQLAISRIIGKPPSRLKRYPRVRGVLEQFARSDHFSRPVRLRPANLALRSELTEDEIVMRVREAIRQCETVGRIPNKKIIAKMVGISLQDLQQSFPKVVLLLNQVVRKQLDDRTKRIKQHEDELVEQVLQAIRHLQTQGKQVTQKEIGIIVGASPENLKHYPKVRVILAQVVAKNREIASERARLYEYELIGKVLDAAVRLDLSGLRVTQSAISNLAGMSLTSLKRYPEVKAFIGRVIAMRYPEKQQNNSRHNKRL